MCRDMDDFILTCDSCAMYKSPGPRRKAGLKPMLVGSPLERVYIDIAGPYPLTASGNKYVLVITDCFTKYVEAYPMPNIEVSLWMKLW